MQKRLLTIMKRHTLWLSLLFHVLFMINFSYVWLHPDKEDPTPSLDIPSYLYNPSITPTPTPLQQQENNEKTKASDKDGIEKPKKTAARTLPTQSRPQEVKSPPVEQSKIDPKEDPVHLIGDSKIVKPLIKILGKALTAHLVYPPMAIDFNLRGTVHVGFLLSPNGQVSDAKVVKSSGAGVLDDAAVKAVNAMSPVSGVKPYVSEPRFLVVGIIFG